MHSLNLYLLFFRINQIHTLIGYLQRQILPEVNIHLGITSGLILLVR
jgi:hypothetical protein